MVKPARSVQSPGDQEQQAAGKHQDAIQQGAGRQLTGRELSLDSPEQGEPLVTHQPAAGNPGQQHQQYRRPYPDRPPAFNQHENLRHRQQNHHDEQSY